LSVPSGDRLDVAGTLMQMDKAGFADVVLMEMQKSDKLGEFSRRAA
ncbi:MAG: hypothetical protein RIR97_1507, partial [Pseudomonadota bacterium]